MFGGVLVCLIKKKQSACVCVGGSALCVCVHVIISLACLYVCVCMCVCVSECGMRSKDEYQAHFLLQDVLLFVAL